MRSCWICNTDPMPNSDLVDMDKILATDGDQGLPPNMPAKHCQHAQNRFENRQK